MIKNFDSLLLGVKSARNRSQLECGFDTANTYLDIALNADAISSSDYHTKKAQLNDAYNNQLIDFNKSPISDFLGQEHQQIVNEVQS